MKTHLSKRRRLSPELAAAADARMQRCLTAYRMSIVYEAARRHGWYTMPADEVERYYADSLAFPGTLSPLPQPGALVPMVDGVYRVEEYREDDDTYSLRKVDGPA